MKRQLPILAAALAVAFIVAGSAVANSPRITRGDVEALFQALQNGGQAIRVNGGDVLEGAPVQPGGRIAALPNTQGRHFCALDWHVIEVAFIEGFPQTEDAHAQAVAVFSSVVAEIRLDGMPLALERTPIKRIDPTAVEQGAPPFGPGTAGYWFQVGQIVAPDALAPGPHTLELMGTVTTPMLTFFVDPAASPTCG